jgi:hypothetical protein
MRIFVIVLGTLLSFGCSHKSSTPTDPGPTDPGTTDPGNNYANEPPFAPASLSVAGSFFEFDTGKALATPGTMATAAVVPSPDVSISGGAFTLDNIPPFSTFYMVAGAPPDHRLTYNAPITVDATPLMDVKAYVVADSYVTKLRTAFNVTAVSGTATVFVQAIDANGAAETGIPAAAIMPSAGGIKGPYFLDATMQPAMSAASTSASGWLVYFNVPAGTLSLAGGTGYTVTSADTPTVGDAVSLVAATVVKGTASAPPPMNVSFQQTVMPIFINRGCYNCHSGNGSGRVLGGLVLDGAPMKVWTALTQVDSPNFDTTRVNLDMPAKSLVLTMPSYENPPDPHPTVVFTSSADPDYVKILTWIKEGAKFN